jgi:aspartyl-tRNA(Asn)/glutamyl-tRNA(Gln) amidotransferase subunit A
MPMSSLETWKSLLSQDSAAYQKQLSSRDASINAFTEIDVARRATDDATLPIAVKDNIAVARFKLTCGSRILANLVSPYDATVVARAVAAGYRPIGKTNLDEFGMGSSTDTSAAGPTNNPWDTDRVAGGSSGGSAAAVAAGMVPLAFGTDTGGSVRQPASFCGVYGLKPTYGALSRYGLVAYASSLEVAGVLSDTIDGMESLYTSVAGEDVMDQTSLAVDESGKTAGASSSAGKPAARRIGFLGGDLGLDERTSAGYEQMKEAARAAGYTLEEITLDTAEYVVPAYYTIATAEASANLARFNGVRYGERPVFAENPEELVRLARGQGFGSEVKLRILLGTYVLRSGFQEQYYQRAQKIRTRIRSELASVFERVDMILSPVFPTAAFKHGQEELDAFQQKVADRFTTLANLAAIPAVSIPAGVHNGLPVGIQAMGPQLSDLALLSFARDVEKQIPYQRPPDFPKSIAEAGGGA